VELDGFYRHVNRRCNFLIGLTFCDQLQNFPLSQTES
jgi:hypothetical protein